MAVNLMSIEGLYKLEGYIGDMGEYGKQNSGL